MKQGADVVAFSPKIGVTRADFDCGINLICQILGTMLAASAAMRQVLVAPYRDGSGPADLLGMKALVTHIVYGRVCAGMCVTMVFGNVYYAFMAYRMMRRERRNDVTCLPYGVNAPAAFAFVFSIVAKAAQAAHDEGMGWEEGILYAWRVGCVANIVAGAVATLFGLVGPYVMGVAPKASLLIAIAGIGFTYLGINQALVCFRAGYAGLLPLGLTLACFFGGVRTSPVPTAVVVMLVAAAIGWAGGQGWPEGEGVKLGGTPAAVERSLHELGLYLPHFLDAESFAQIPAVVRDNIAIILPVSLTGAVGTLLSVHAAHEVGDRYSVRECMVVEGISTMVAGLFGSPLGTCVFIGHPQYKAQGGKVCYSFVNMVIFCLLALTGSFATVSATIPPYAIASVIIFVGLAINQDAVESTPARQLPAAVLGLFPPIADWVVSIWPRGKEPPRELQAIANGALMLSMLWTALGVFIIQRQFKQGAAWSLLASVLAGLGLIHQGKMDLSLRTFAGRPGEFGTSCCAFAVGYATLALGLAVLACLQACGCDRVPPPCTEEDDARAQKAGAAETASNPAMSVASGDEVAAAGGRQDVAGGAGESADAAHPLAAAV